MLELVVALRVKCPTLAASVVMSFEKYKGAEKVWVQEEPKNMGAFTFLRRYAQFDDFKLIARKSSASPATGYASVHAQEQAKIVNNAFSEKIEQV